MAATAPQGPIPSPDPSLQWELSRRRVFLFFAATSVAIVVGVLFEESDQLLHLMDDLAILLLMGGVVAFLGSSWKRQALPELRRQNNVAVVLAAVALAFQIAAFPIEISDPADFGNEIPFLIFLLATIVNRFA